MRESLPDAAVEPPHPQWILHVGYPRSVRKVLLLAVTGVLAITACGASAATRSRPIKFGLTGGNIAGYSVSIKPRGQVTIKRTQGVRHRKIAAKRVRRLGQEISGADFAKSRICAGSLPDMATEYIRLGTQTYRLRGRCEPRFQRVWRDLTHAVGR